MKVEQKNEVVDQTRYFDLDVYVQPSESRKFTPISFRWVGADIERKVFDNNPYKVDLKEFN